MDWMTIGVSVGIPLLTFAAAWGGAKASMNGLKEDIKEMRKTCCERGIRLQQHGERLAAIEAVHINRKD